MWQELISDTSCSATCARCDRVLQTKSHLIAHLKYSHDLRGTKFVYECLHCDKVCSRDDNLDKHLWLHQSANFRCSECPATFKRPDYLISHLRRVHDKIVRAKSEHRCNMCDKVFKSGANLIMHSHKHSPPDRDCYCQLCKRQFLAMFQFQTHMKVFHTNIEKKPTIPKESKEMESCSCARCSHEFLTKAHLLAHLKWVHDLSRYINEPISYSCHVCVRVCFSLNRFDRHLSVHKERSISCSMCPIKYKNEDNLASHMRSYHHISDESQVTHTCTVCGRSFKTSGGLTQHSAFHKPKRFTCDVCGIMFFSNGMLWNHMRDVHIRCSTRQRERKHKCPMCPEKFFVSSELRKHLLKIHAATADYAKSYCLSQKSKSPRPSKPFVSKTAQQCQFVSDYRWDLPTTWSTTGVSYICAICCRPGFNRRFNIWRHLTGHYRNM